MCRFWGALPSQILRENAELIMRPMVEQMTGGDIGGE